MFLCLCARLEIFIIKNTKTKQDAKRQLVRGKSKQNGPETETA